MSDTGYGDFEFERRFWVRHLPVDLLDESPTVIVQSYFLAHEGYALHVRVQTSGGVPAVDPSLTPLQVLDAYEDRFDFCKGAMV